MKRIILAVAAILAVFGILFVSGTPSASAHERRTVAGKYTFVVGFLNEPVFLEQPNAVSLTVANAQPNDPVEGVEKTLKVDVTAGGQTKTMDLKARFGQKGAYTADVVPTKGGSWVFRFTGTIEGTQIDERFESGPGRFNEPQPVSELQFPVKLPSISELAAQRTGQPGEGAAAPAPQSPDVRRALDRANSARTFGIVGIIVGVLGLAVAAYALLSRRTARPRATGGPSGGRPEPV